MYYAKDSVIQHHNQCLTVSLRAADGLPVLLQLRAANYHVKFFCLAVQSDDRRPFSTSPYGIRWKYRATACGSIVRLKKHASLSIL